MAEYCLTPAAENDLAGIWRYSFQKWGGLQADIYVDSLAKVLAELASFPEIAFSCEHIRAGYRHWHFERHMIYFHQTDYGIVVIRILHVRMNALSHLQ